MKHYHRMISFLLTLCLFCSLMVPVSAGDTIDIFSLYDGEKLKEEHYTDDLVSYMVFLIEYYRTELAPYDPNYEFAQFFYNRELLRAYNGDFPHPYLAGRVEENGEVTITGLKATNFEVPSPWFPLYYKSEVRVSEIVIPDEIDGRPVTKIANRAFEYHEHGMGYRYVDVVIGDNVRVIGDRAFYDNDRIRSVTFGKNVETIGSDAFWNCYCLDEITTWGESLRSIGRAAFSETHVVFPPLPDTLETIEEDAFKRSYLPDRFVIPKNTERIGSDVFINAEDMTELIVLSRTATIEGDLANTYDPVDLFCYAGSTAEANAQQFERAYHLIDGESLVFDGQTVEDNVLQLGAPMTEADFLARAASNGEECEVRLSGLADGKVVNGTTVTLWNNRVDAEGKVYTVRCEQGMQAAGDTDGDGGVGLADVTLLIRYLAGGWNVTINLSAADVDGDGLVNLKDATLLRRYLAGGWNVVLR